MQTKLDEAKAERLAEAARMADHSPAGGHHPVRGLEHDALGAYLQRYYLHTAPEDLADRDPVDILGAALAHYRLAQDRPQGTANVRVYSPSIDENGWSNTHTVVEVVTDDMPFLVDSVTNELTRQGRGIHAVIHPQMVVRRDLTGKLLEVLAAGRDDPATQAGTSNGREELPHDALVESWIHVEIDRETDRDDLKQINTDLLRTLSDVREAVEDWQKMKGAALRIADDLADEPTDDLPEQEIEEARELLRWLSDDHFTFLGYREYELGAGEEPQGGKAGGGTGAKSGKATKGGKSAKASGGKAGTDGKEGEELSLTPVPGTGLGILRSDPHHSSVDGHPVSPRSTASRRTRGPRRASTGCWCSRRRTAARRCTVPRTSTTWASRSSTPRATSSGSGASWGCSPPPPTPSRCAASPSSGARSPRCWRARASRRTATRAVTCSRSWRPTRATSCSRPRPTSCATSSPPSSTSKSAASCASTCARTSTGATTPRWSTSRATATPPGSGCG